MPDKFDPAAGSPLTPEEAQAAYDAAPSVPLSDERIDEIVRYATGGGKPLTTLRTGQRIRIIDPAHPMHGCYGTVARLRMRDDSAFVALDVPPAESVRLFQNDDESGRGNHVELWPDQCEGAG